MYSVMRTGNCSVQSCVWVGFLFCFFFVLLLFYGGWGGGVRESVCVCVYEREYVCVCVRERVCVCSVCV